jgi:hypothetical protein
MSMKNSNNTIGNRTRNLPDGSAVPQPTAPPRAPSIKRKPFKNKEYLLLFMSVECLQDIKKEALS